MRQPSNLTPEAIEDYRAALKKSRSFGPTPSRDMRRRLLACFHLIASGAVHGHKHQSVTFAQPTLCVVVYPLLVFYSPVTRLVLRVVDGRRDLPALFAGGP